VPGTFGTGTIPATGAGTRMMWYPAKAALHAGRVDGNQWNDANVGEHSVAFGPDTKASNFAATAMGNNTTAASNHSLSLGRWNDANTSQDNTLLVVGNGSNPAAGGSRSDALVLDQSGNLEISGSLIENSDRRLKEQIQPLGKGTLGKLGEIRPVRFRFKNERTHPAGQQLGLVAQDVQKEFTALVSEGTDGDLSVSYSKFTAVLLKGLQEQQSQIEGQRTRIEKQQATIDSLRTRLQQIESLQKRVARLEAQSGRRTAQPVSNTPAPEPPKRKE
jgi:hypothetical protein